MNTTLTAGLGLKPEHYEAALACPAAGLWFEVHPENHFVDGGPRLAWLETIRAVHPLSLHGVGLSLAADAPPDREHLAKLAALARRVEPALMSEHLAWNAWRGFRYPDLLPFARTREALLRIAANIGLAQDALGRPLAIENPSHYLHIESHDYDEIDFLTELSRRSGCRLLLDVNNVHVGARNTGYSAEAYVDAFPTALIAEVHLAGHTPDARLGDALLVDSHDMPVAPEVWALYQRLIARIGARPTLIERDANLPAFDDLLDERDIAHAVLQQASAAMAEAA